MFPQHQIERDLFWVLQSPALLDDIDLDPLSIYLFDRSAAWIDRANANSQLRGELQQFLISRLKSYRVGDYFEALVHFALVHVAGYRILAHRQQIQIKDRTAGEIDFIYEDHAGSVVHLEVAVKFFLAQQHNFSKQGSSLPDSHRQYPMPLLGPNPRDSLTSKLERLRKNQFPMGELTDFSIDRRQLLLMGRIHLPLSWDGDLRQTISADAGQVAENCEKGLWIRLSDLPRLRYRYPQACYVLLPKPFWLSALPPLLGLKTRSAVQLQSPNRGRDNVKSVTRIASRQKLATDQTAKQADRSHMQRLWRTKSLYSWEELNERNRRHFLRSDRTQLWGILQPISGAFPKYKLVNRLFVVSDTWPNPTGS